VITSSGSGAETEPLEALWRRYGEELPTWRAVGDAVAARLRELTVRKGVLASVSARPKELDSLLRKALDKGRVDDLAAIRDKAGARCSTYFPEDAELVASMIREGSLFEVVKEDNKIVKLGDDKIGYLGIHFDVVVDAAALPDGLPPVEGPLWCEVQVHTAAQTLFASVEHPLTYKTPTKPDMEVSRAIKRLSVVGEIFDNELRLARSAITNQAGYPSARLMFTLERHFLALAGREGDPELTRTVVEALTPLYGDQSADEIEAAIESFVAEKEEVLKWFYEHYGDGTVPLVLQPVTVLIFERLAKDAFALKERWVEAGLPFVLLERLTAAWGSPVR